MTADDHPGDIIEIGGPARDDRPRRPWRKWLPLVLVVGVGLAVYARTGADSRADRPPVTRPPSATTAAASPSGPTPTSTAPVVTEVDHPLLGVDAGWQLHGRGPGAVVRIDLAAGRVTTTPVPALLSTGPVNFLVGPDRVVVRPLDAVPGYVVPDGAPAAEATGDFSHGGAALPGPDPTSVWVSDDEAGRMLLVRFDGRRAGRTLELPQGTRSFAEPDGAGYPLVAATGGVYSLRPDGVHRITTGEVLAVGPRHWLARECDERLRCGTVLIEQRDGARRAVPLRLDESEVSRGLISPDGTRAAIWVTASGGTSRFHLLDLRSGRNVLVDLAADPGFFQQRMAWSPDGRWLFVAGSQLQAVEVETGRTREFGVALPQIDQIAVRAG
ncbi:hypothetical protein ONA91_29415 [Micromonospora sp. DR5-3]|uniref:hypothetical protein n=1 Tax=unclassified Micromonospora TaxID=2617518 RepID=UPI0011D6E97E|nr:MULTISPECIES: hypothetical protein [unclassified Micromonospora]MCW3818565.1 hypothetical protein [Micromonospora sp. DR5-3]TYC20147.1 hypothetical protein FXF52_32795 [Micromonospora sp. MP36]